MSLRNMGNHGFPHLPIFVALSYLCLSYHNRFFFEIIRGSLFPPLAFSMDFEYQNFRGFFSHCVSFLRSSVFSASIYLKPSSLFPHFVYGTLSIVMQKNIYAAARRAFIWKQIVQYSLPHSTVDTTQQFSTLFFGTKYSCLILCSTFRRCILQFQCAFRFRYYISVIC